MGFYSRIIFPRGLDFCMSNAILSEHRATLLSRVEGDVLEIGFGTGLNIPHYPKSINKLVTVDINPGMNALAKKRVKNFTVPLESKVLNGEKLPMDDNSFDSVVSTWTLCSIQNVDQALKEISRVLKLNGRFFFIEHGLSDEPKIQRWQNRLNPVQKFIADGCHLNRDMKEIIQKQGFKIVELEKFYMEGHPKTHAYTFKGIATKLEKTIET